ncbi:hypothetical protein [Dyella sp.]|uniref:hypothetical protein n=1 Tax=Dyella sp. TaxID=1869338 RepID=UPI002D785FBD|nr:hypothetical protein [Dyella sp.]HET7332874.1 hypothetical protein [Dyella sp.]
MHSPQAMIFAPLNDAHASAVHWALERNGMETLWAPSLHLGEAARFSIHAGRGGIKAIGPWGNSSDLKSVWTRVVKAPQIEGLAEFDHKFVHKQWEIFQRNAFELAADLAAGLWVNHPIAAYAAESKLLQLKVANEVGLPIPDTVVTNDAVTVRDMVGKLGKVVFKQFYDFMWKNHRDGKLYGSSPSILDRESDLPDDAIALCPGIYQRYIDKTFDLRVTMIGERFFSAKLRRKDRDAYVDWRPHVYEDELLLEEFTLPASVEVKLRALMKRLGLVFGCIDLVADKEGDFYFLEVNQQGQFLFVEEQVPDLPVLKAMTAMMLQGRVDYSMNIEADVCFAEYRQSDEHARLLAAPLEKSDIFVVEA